MADVRWRRRVGPLRITKLSVGSFDNNVYVIGDDRECVLIDGADEADALLGEVGGRGLVRILQTHGHGDHVRALPELVKRTSAPVFTHAADARMLPVRTEILDDGDRMAIPGGLDLEIRHTPGHTPGGVCFVLRSGSETHLFSGDTLFPGGPGATRGDARAFGQIMQSLREKLFVLPDDTSVYPGHGADTTLGTERPSLPGWEARGW